MPNNQSNDSTIKFKDLLNQIIEKWYIILIIFAVCLSTTFIYTRFFIDPKYQSTAKIFIMDTTSDKLSSGEISVSSYLTKDYEELIVDRTVLEQVIDDLDLKFSYKTLKNCISIYNPQSTRILEITVTTGSPTLSKKIADCICSVSQDKIVELMSIDRVNILSNGNLPSSQSSPVMQINLMKSLLFALILCCVTILIICIRDDKIKNSEDIEEYLGISLLGSIPYSKKK